MIINNCQIKIMENGQANYQNFKNKKRLIHQNIKLRNQVLEISRHITQFIGKQQPILDQAVQQEEANKIEKQRSEISQQQKYIRLLKSRIDKYNQQNAKQNVMYIQNEETELLMIKKQHQHFVDEKNIYLKFRDDKLKKLQSNIAFETHRKNVQHDLKQVIKFNKQKAVEIVDIERQIRKLHLIKETNKSSQRPKQQILKQIERIQKEIDNVVIKKQQLQSKWKPQFQQLDLQHQQNLKLLSKKQSQAIEAQRKGQMWETRMTVVRSEQDVIKDKQRKSMVKIDEKLKKQIEEIRLIELQKSKKKVNNDELKYKFSSNAPQEQTKTVIPLLGKKKDQKVIQTILDDKNISILIDKNNQKKNSQKTNQIVNTQQYKMNVKSDNGSLKSKRSKKSSNSQLSTKKKQIGNQDQERSQRKWQQTDANPELPALIKNRLKLMQQKNNQPGSPKQSKDGNHLLLKNIGMGTSFNEQDDNQQI